MHNAFGGVEGTFIEGHLMQITHVKVFAVFVTMNYINTEEDSVTGKSRMRRFEIVIGILVF